MTRTHLRCLLTLALGWTAFRPALADTAPAPLPPVVARYEQMLAASPAKGTAFDKVYQHFFEGPGLDALAARWQARAASGGPGAETFPLLVGLLAERRAHPDEARRGYQQYNATHPDDPRGWTALGELESAEGHFGPAAEALAHALAPGAKPPVPASTRPTLYRELARAQTRSFLTAASLGTWRKLAAEFPDDPGILQEVGEAFQEDQAYDEARATFEKVRALARKNNDAFGRINATLRTGQVEEARGHATEAVKIYEGVVAEAKTGSWLEREARARIEQLYRGQEDLPGLADYYKKWLEDHPKDTEVATRRAAVLIELNRRPEAIDLLKQAVSWAPERQELQVELARRLGETDRPAEGAAVMEKLTTVAPEEKSYWQLLGDARWQLRENLPATAPAADRDALKARALAAWTHLSPADGKDAAATGQLADLLASHRLKDEALAQYARAAALAPDLPDARERWAGYLAQLDRKDEARQVIAGLVTSSPASANAANFSRLANALDRLDDPAGALAATEQGLAREPHNFDLLSQRWQLLATRKRWTDAAALYPALLAAAPNAYFTEQVQARQVAALQAADQVADTRAALAARLGGKTPPPLDENDLALLVRIDLQISGLDDADTLAQAKQVLAEARERFPRAAAFARLEGELAKHARDVVGQVAALRRLIDLQPAQKTDALAEIARVWRDAARPDDAIAAANELVGASPANASAQLLLADLLLQGGHPEEGVARLRDAVRLSEKPNEVRLRLARVQSDLGRDADARRTLDEAFENAGDAHERLSVTRPLAEAYQRENHLDELITRFQTLQQGDAEGWRYALYLAEIYQGTKDYGAARRELAKALAARPRDGSLLRQLVRVAEQEQNTAEIARYQTLLAEVEPSDQNKFALVTSLLENNQADAGFNALRANLAAVLKTPGAWDQLLPLLARNDLTARAGDLLNAEMGGDRADLKARFTLALFQAVAGNSEQARAALWTVFDTKTGPAPLVPPSPRKNTASGTVSMRLVSLVYGGDSIPEQRYRAGEVTRRTAQGLLYPGGLAGFGRGRGVFAMPMTPSGLPNTPSLTDTTRDAALLYLAALAVQDHTAAEFMAELDRHLAARDSSRADRLVAYSLMQDVDSQTREIAAQVRNPEPGLDGLALARTALIAFNNGPQYRRYSEVPPLSAAQTDALAPLFEPLLARLIQSEPALDAAETPSLRYSFLIGMDHKAEAEAVRRDFLARVDAHAPVERLEAALGLLLEGDFSPAERAQLRSLVPAFSEAASKAVGRTGSNQHYYYPAILFQEGSEAGKLSPEDFADTLTAVIPLWYPVKTPAAGSLASAGGSQYRSQNAEGALPPSRFFDQNTFQMIQSVSQSLHQGEAARLPAVLACLDQQAKDLPPERRIYPQVVAAYLDALNGEPAAVLPRAQALLAAAPEDNDVRLLTGVLLGRTDRHAEALALLNTVDVARTGESPFAFQKTVLAEAKAAKDTESAKRAALRLAAMRVPPEERDALSASLRELGLTEQADLFAKTVASASPAGSGQGRSVFDTATAQQLDRLTNEKNESGALALVRNVLAALPPPVPAPNSYGNRSNFEYVLRSTLATLKKFSKTDAFVADAEKQIAKDPDSLSLNYQLAVLHQEADTPDTAQTRARTNQRSPVWLRLARLDTGEIVGSWSADGQDWHEIDRAKVSLGDAPLAVLPAAVSGKSLATTLTVDQVALTPPPPPETDAAPAPGASSPPLPAPWTETQLPDEGDAAPAPPAAWHDGVFTLHARGWDLWGGTDGARLVHRPLGGATEFTARLVSTESPTTETKTGLMLRAGLSPDAPYAAVIVLPNGFLSFQHRDRADQATAYWRKLAALRPRETRYQRFLAHRLAQRGLRDEAVTIYDRLIDQGPEEALSAYDEVQFIYKGRRMLALADRILAWKPTAPLSSSGPRNYGYTYFQVARECATQKRPDLVIAVCRRGIEIDTANGYGGQDSELYQLLTTTLIEQNRRDEARDALVASFVPPTPPGLTGGPNANATQLGFRNVLVRYGSTRSWMTSLSWSLDSIEFQGLRPLETARTAGLLPGLQAALQARQTADPDDFARNDLPWLLTLIRLDLHDPTLLPALPEILNRKPDAKSAASRGNEQGEVAVRLAVARRLQRWPGQEALALEALASAQKWVANARKSNNVLSGNLVTAINFQQVRAQLALDDAPSAVGTLRAMGAETTSSNPTRGGNSYEELRRYLGLLLRAGPEADPIYTEVFNQTTKTLEARKNLYFAYDLEKNVRQGDNPHFQAFAWLLDDGGPATGSPDATLVYELRPEHPFDKAGSGRYPGSHGRSFPASEGERTLTFSYGPDPEHFAPIGQLKTDRTFGTWTGPIPPGAGVVKVTIDSPRAKDAAALAAEAAAPPAPSPGPSASPLPAGTPAPAAGPPGDYWLPVVRTPNLLANPNFDGLANRDPNAETFSIPGWKDLPAGLWKTSTTDNPFPGRPFVRSDTFNQQSYQIIGERIPVEAGKSYFQSGWVRDGGDNSAVRLGRRFLDADGSVIKTTECPGFSTLGWRWHSQRLSSTTGQGDDGIPPKAAFIEPFLRVQGSSEWTGLFLGRIN